MGIAYLAAAVGFLFGLHVALAPEYHWRHAYGRMIEGARPTAEGLTSIRRWGVAIMVLMVLLAIVGLWFQIESERRTHRALESLDVESMKRILHPPGSPLDLPPER